MTHDQPLPLSKLQSLMTGPASTGYPKPEQLIAGNPRRDTWNVVNVGLTGSRLFCGIWHCEPGHWRIEVDNGHHELFTVLSGLCRVHADDGTSQQAGPGEAIFIPGGFRGSFEVLEALSKTYAIVSPVE